MPASHCRQCPSQERSGQILLTKFWPKRIVQSSVTPATMLTCTGSIVWILFRNEYSLHRASTCVEISTWPLWEILPVLRVRCSSTWQPSYHGLSTPLASLPQPLVSPPVWSRWVLAASVPPAPNDSEARKLIMDFQTRGRFLRLRAIPGAPSTVEDCTLTAQAETR